MYKLYDAGIATYEKTQDPETKWYNWKFDQKKISDIITKKYEKSSEEIDKSIKYEEKNMFFTCKANGHRYKFEKHLKPISYVPNVVNHSNIRITQIE